MPEDHSGLNRAAAWLPDLFAWLWLRLEPESPQIASYAHGDFLIGEVVKIAGQLRTGLDADGGTPATIVRYVEDDASRINGTLQQRYVVAKAIDIVLGEEVLRSGPRTINPGLERIRAHFHATGRLSRGLDLVLPADPSGRRPLPDHASGDRLAVQFRYLLAVSSARFEDKVNWRRIAARHDFAWRPGEATLRVGVVPLAQAETDVQIVLLDFNNEPRIQVRHTAVQESVLAERARAAVRMLEEQKVRVAIFPEWVVSPLVAKAISGELTSSTLRRGGDTYLELVVAGSGLSEVADPSELAYNECHVFNRIGHLLWSQKKLNHYRMQRSVLEACGLDPRFDRMEHFRSGTVLEVVDSSLGRLAVLICEDLTQNDPGRRVFDDLRPDWVFAPVLDRGLDVGRWVGEEAMELVRDYAANVVVVNSLVLPDRCYRVSLAPPGEVGAALLVSGAEYNRHNVLRTAVPAGDGALTLVADWRPNSWPARRVAAKP